MSNSKIQNNNLPNINKLSLNNITKNLQVIGETGAGKSSFINLWSNLFLGGTVDSLKNVIPTKYLKETVGSFKNSEIDPDDTKKSTTNECNEYLFEMNGSKYNLVDSPGFNDTRGTAQDNINLDKILKKLESLSTLGAIIVVINGSNPRLTVNMKNVLVKIKCNVPDSMKNSFCFVMTNCWEHSSNFDLTSLDEFLQPDKSNVFYINNSRSCIGDVKSKSPRALQKIVDDWNDCISEVKNLIHYIDSTDSVSANDFIEMRKSRDEIQAHLHDVKLEIKNLLKADDEVTIAKAQLEGFETSKDKFKEYTRNVPYEEISLVDAGYHSTICKKCDYVCHDHCSLDELNGVGNSRFKGCCAIDGPDDTCIECPKKCSYSVHYHAKKTMIKTLKTLENVLHEIKDKYDAAIKGINETKLQINTAEETSNSIKKTIKKKSDSIAEQCRKIKSICSGFDFIGELSCTIDLLEMEGHSINTPEARKESDNVIRSLRELVKNLKLSQ
eukprot:gene8479-10420_t